ncbi:MAG: menaquinone biosynthetic enzyme MqnA/MqnD family protein [Chitinophagales bacterium]
MESKLSISLVSYLNTKPFLYGIQHSDFGATCDLQLDVPSESGRKILQNEVDIALAPVAVLHTLPNAKIITEYCIGATKKVQTVSLFSNVPIEKIQTIYPDTHSLTSIQLLKILLKEYWKRDCVLADSFISDSSLLQKNEAILAIGDKSFSLQGNFQFQYDLAEAWHNLTGLPFVFAAWITRKNISSEQEQQLNNALQYGMQHIPQVIEELQSALLSHEELNYYFTENISYNFDNKKKLALNVFLQKIKLHKLSPQAVL